MKNHVIITFKPEQQQRPSRFIILEAFYLCFLQHVSVSVSVVKLMKTSVFLTYFASSSLSHSK